ncbi:hypothetical protein N657DRAFT_636136 [Parathielavia appendiculata]|uniref:Secreted protein n=1 Tax=Parathielavia appendiculata TaxID=2587402 RepID=A0AAN6TUS3_9PEZI|nr:hypothetical protein N657DRAFT_636136 [Parathielavia appendiculata]
MFVRGCCCGVLVAFPVCRGGASGWDEQRFVLDSDAVQASKADEYVKAVTQQVLQEGVLDQRSGGGEKEALEASKRKARSGVESKKHDSQGKKGEYCVATGEERKPSAR